MSDKMKFTVWDMIQQLGACDPNDEVVIKVEGVSFGQTPNIKIHRIINGFDWDNGKAIITTVEKLKVEK